MESNDQQIQWIRNDKVKQQGYLLIELPDVTNARIKELFGKLPAGISPNNGYSDAIVITNNLEPIRGEATFMYNACGIYTLYTLFGKWRIGGFSNNKYVDELKNYIYGK